MAATAPAPVPAQNLKEWHTPSTRTEVIQELISGVDRYNPSNLSFMEDYLQNQVATGEYDLLANIAILKLYQFNPQLSNPDVIINILIKALSATVHGPDFNLCLALLPEPSAIVQAIDSDDESLTIIMPFIQNLHDLVQGCKFTKFWAEFNGPSEAASLLRSNPNYFPAHDGLVAKLRAEFGASIAASFRRVRTAQLARWLDLKEAEIVSWCKAAGWEIDGEVAVVPENGDNNVKAGVVKENVQLKQLTKLVAAAAF